MISGLQPDTQQINRQQFEWLAKETNGYKHLAAEIGAERSDSIVDIVFDNLVREHSPNDRYLMISPNELPFYTEKVESVLGTECEQIDEKLTYLTTLLKATMAGDLREHLEGAVEAEQNYTTPSQLPPGGRRREIAKAADWIAASMHGDESRAQVLECLNKHVLDEPRGIALGKTPAEILDKIHCEIVLDAPRVRGPNPNTAYPSSIGGRFLQNHVFKWTSRIIWPGPGEEIWRDVALFYLGSVMTVQGYTDGNKRMGRTAYALTLLKAELPFDAPNSALEAGLARMQRPSEL